MSEIIIGTIIWSILLTVIIVPVGLLLMFCVAVFNLERKKDSTDKEDDEATVITQ